MRTETKAIVCVVRTHGEHGAVVRLMTPDHGLMAAYVRGARGRRMRPVLIPGNVVQAELSARTETQLPQASIELMHSRGPLLSEPLPAAAIEWAAVLTAIALPEGPIRHSSYGRKRGGGALIGAVAGGIIGNNTGLGTGAGAALGAAAGGVTGGAIGHRQDERAGVSTTTTADGTM